MLEAIAGVLSLIRQLIWINAHSDVDSDPRMDRITILFNLFVVVVLIPSSYLMNNETVKLLIAAQGWTAYIRNVIRRGLRQNTALNENEPIPLN